MSTTPEIYVWNFEVIEISDKSGWTVEVVGPEGDVRKTNFYGYDAFHRAARYAVWEENWMNKREQPGS